MLSACRTGLLPLQTCLYENDDKIPDINGYIWDAGTKCGGTNGAENY